MSRNPGFPEWTGCRFAPASGSSGAPTSPTWASLTDRLPFAPAIVTPARYVRAGRSRAPRAVCAAYRASIRWVHVKKVRRRHLWGIRSRSVRTRSEGLETENGTAIDNPDSANERSSHKSDVHSRPPSACRPGRPHASCASRAVCAAHRGRSATSPGRFRCPAGRGRPNRIRRRVTGIAESPAGRSPNHPLDGRRITRWTVAESPAGRSPNHPLDGRRITRWSCARGVFAVVFGEPRSTRPPCPICRASSTPS